MYFVLLGILACIASHVMAATGGNAFFQEPQCSKFSFEEKILEKVIRFEVTIEEIKGQFENMESKLRQEQADLSRDKDVTLEEVRTLKNDIIGEFQEMRGSLEGQQSAANSRIDELITKTEAQVTRMSGDVHSLVNTTIAQIRDEATSLAVAFSARNVADLTPGLEDVLVFTESDLNLGDGYDVGTGRFTVPVSGVYLFGIQLCLMFNHKKGFGLVTDDGATLHPMMMSTGMSSYGALNGLACLAETAVVSLVKSDVISVKCTYAGAGSMHQSDAVHNIFSGALIQKL